MVNMKKGLKEIFVAAIITISFCISNYIFDPKNHFFLLPAILFYVVLLNEKK